MSTSRPDAVHDLHRLRTARVLRVQEDACEVWSDRERSSVRFASIFPSPRVERVSPGHLVAIATGPTGSEVVVWRWYDAVVLDTADDGSVRLWEPGHGEVIARPRASFEQREPGSRSYASAGLPGAEWWVAGSVNSAPHSPDVELGDVTALYDDNNLWPTVFASSS